MNTSFLSYIRNLLPAMLLLPAFAVAVPEKGLDNNYVIPVVVHIISQNPGAITDLQIMNAINDLNNAFAHTGIYGSGPGANTHISFCLAKLDPDGGITNGITRTQSVLGDFDADLENDRMKNLVSWDPRQYCNIWYVDGIESEIYPKFSCGTWQRMHEGGYSGLSDGSNYTDGIVVTSFGTLLAHEMGHYLGLAHTFVIGSCTNNNCAIDGDGVCDTPPQSVVGGSCTAPQNSCSTDTLSGFTVDMPDLNSNFMSYSGSCTNEFTEGQASKMRNNLLAVRSSLLAQSKCSPPCTANILAGFTRDNWSPSTGSLVHFTSTSTGGSSYQWLVDGVPVGSNSPAYSQVFAAPGKYKVTLKVTNGNPACYSAYSDFVIVTCGVLARFYPDKRLIASKDPIYLDSVLFTNRSVNANAYQWLIGNDQGMAEQVVSTGFNLSYTFRVPANYTIRMIASSGSCADTTETFNLLVEDPTPDGTVNFSDVECYQETKIKVTVNVCNSGFDTIPANTPISFYDADPRVPGAHLLGSPLLLPDPVKGSCCSSAYEYILDINRPGLDQLYAVFNDNGTTSPLALPNTSFQEISYANNVNSRSNFQFRVSVSPVTDTLQPGDTLQLSAAAGPGAVASYTWSTADGLSCTNCQEPLLIAGKKDITKEVTAASGYGCVDSAFSVIKVPPADDYTITLQQVNCSGQDSLRAGFTICNLFKRGEIPPGLRVSFYDADPADASAHLLPPVFTAPAAGSGRCISFSQSVLGTNNGTLYAVVNDSGSVAPVILPQDTLFLEKDYTNNTDSFQFQSDTVALQPEDTTVFRGQALPVHIQSAIYDPSSINWLPGSGYSLDCFQCSSPVATITGNSFIQMSMSNQYGCKIQGTATIKIFPPDMTVQVVQTNCYTNDSLLVKFTVCMNNNYDSVFAGIPVSFYDLNNGAPALLQPVFFTTGSAGNCASFQTIIRSPASPSLLAVVNDKGQGATIPDPAFDETDYTNDTAGQTIIPFSVSIDPSDTTLMRFVSVQLDPHVTGGQMSSFSWDPVSYLSCSTCLTPVATPPYSIQYKLHVKNEYSCTATGLAKINTVSGGRVNIPNAFTPNQDGRNDVFYVLGGRDVQIIKDFSIYNRWGEKIFQANNAPANDPSFGWDGTFNGKASDAGAYVYIITVAFTDGTQQTFKGSVVLIR
jgi:gliding motility-associated-like protein